MKREELLVNAKPILFNTEMVKAILESRKTVTRRVIKLDLGLADSDKNDSSCLFVQDKYGDSINVKDLCRYQVGDILYVRETWKKLDTSVLVDLPDNSYAYIYKASENGKVWERESNDWTWEPSIHMPKEAARIFLKVTNVRVERLQDMYEEDAKKEGCKSTAVLTPEGDDYFGLYAIDSFSVLWDSTIKKQDLDTNGWEANPYVWVIEFEKVNYE